MATAHQREIGSVGRAAFGACRMAPTSKSMKQCAMKFTRTYWHKREAGSTKTAALHAAKKAAGHHHHHHR